MYHHNSTRNSSVMIPVRQDLVSSAGERNAFPSPSTAERISFAHDGVHLMSSPRVLTVWSPGQPFALQGHLLSCARMSRRVQARTVGACFGVGQTSRIGMDWNLRMNTAACSSCPFISRHHLPDATLPIPPPSLPTTSSQAVEQISRRLLTDPTVARFSGRQRRQCSVN